MSGKSNKIEFKEPLDSDNLIFEKDTCFPKAYKIFFPLNSSPDSKWEKCFDRVAGMAEAYLGRRISINGDNLVIVATLEEMNREFFDKLQEIIDDANKCAKEEK